MHTLHKISGIRKTLRFRLFALATTWILGLLTSVYLLFKTSFASLMYSVASDRVSIIGLLVSLVFPILFSYILLRCFHFYYILPIVFVKAFTFMCCYGWIMIAYRNAGWLICGLLLFSDGFLVVFLLQLWLHSASGQLYSSRLFARSYILALLVIGCIDYFAVSPYVSMLLK